MHNKTHILLFLTAFLCSLLVYGCSSKTQKAETLDTDTKTTAMPESNEPVAEKNKPQVQKQEEILVLPLDSAQSWVRIEVMKKDKLEQLGYDLSLENHNLAGKIIWDSIPANVQAEIILPVEQFSIDAASHRENGKEEFPEEVSINDILSIRRTMLGDRVLAAATYPAIKIVIRGVAEPSIDQAVDIILTVKGQKTTIRTAARVYMFEGTVTLSGRLKLTQSELGITPVTILMGKLTVEDTLQIEYHFEARITQDNPDQQ